MRDRNFFYAKDFVPAFDYYSLKVIANNDYLKSQEEAKIHSAVSHQYAIEHLEELVDILIKQAPALGNQRDFAISFPKYSSSHHASDKTSGGSLMGVECFMLGQKSKDWSQMTE